MPLARIRRCASLVATLAFLGACHDTTSPRAEPEVPKNDPSPGAFDPAATLARFEPIGLVLDQPIFDSFEGVLPFFEHFFRTPVPPSSSISPIGSNLLGGTQALTRRLAPLAAVTASAVPIGARGVTFVYDPATNLYVADPKATGAPANGARFILYEWDGTKIRPASPLRRIGFVDVSEAEASIPEQEITHIVIVRDGANTDVANFFVSHITSNGTTSSVVSGTASDDKTNIQILVGATRQGPAGNQLVFNTTVATAAHDVMANEQFSFDQTTASQGGRLDLRYDNHIFSDENVGTGLDIKFDGTLYARIVFGTPPQGVQYLKPDGAPLASNDVTKLNALLNRVVSTTFFWVELVWP